MRQMIQPLSVKQQRRQIYALVAAILLAVAAFLAGRPGAGTAMAVVIGITVASLAARPRHPKLEQVGDSGIAGKWKLVYATDESGGERQGRGAITLVLKTGNGKVSGTAFVSGPGGEKRERKLIDPRFDGKYFRFKVDNGEGALAGELKYKAGVFAGHWQMESSRLKGSLEMTRGE